MVAALFRMQYLKEGDPEYFTANVGSNHRLQVVQHTHLSTQMLPHIPMVRTPACDQIKSELRRNMLRDLIAELQHIVRCPRQVLLC